MTTAAKAKPIEKVEMDELRRILDEIKGSVGEDEHRKLTAAIETLAFLTSEIEDKRTTIRHLRKLLFGSTSEKTRDVLDEDASEEREESKESEDSEEDSEATPPEGAAGGEEKDSKDSTGDPDGGTPPQDGEGKRPGHGRNGAKEYVGAEQIEVSHESLKSGDPCPVLNCEGRVYRLADPAVLVRIVGNPPLSGTVIRLERLRCNLCLVIFTAKAPEGVGEEKYDVTAVSMMVILRYGSGFPLNRLDVLQASLGVPLPASTQWDVASRAVGTFQPVFLELIRQAAQGQVLYNDDTTMFWEVLDLDDPATESEIDANGTKGGDNTGKREPPANGSPTQGDFLRQANHAICDGCVNTPGQEPPNPVAKAKTETSQEGMGAQAKGISDVRFHYEDDTGNNYKIKASLYKGCAGMPMGCTGETAILTTWRKRLIDLDVMQSQGTVSYYPVTNFQNLTVCIKDGFANSDPNKATYTAFAITEKNLATTHFPILWFQVQGQQQYDWELYPRTHTAYPGAHPDEKYHLLGVDKLFHTLIGQLLFGTGICFPHTYVAVGYIKSAFVGGTEEDVKKTVNHEIAHTMIYYAGVENPDADHTDHAPPGADCAFNHGTGHVNTFCPKHVKKLRGLTDKTATRQWDNHVAAPPGLPYSELVKKSDSGPVQ